MRRLASGLLIALLLCLAGLHAHAANTRVDTLLPLEQVTPGSELSIGLRFRMNPGWHIYWRNPGESGGPPRVDWSLPPGFSVGDFEWPAPEKYVASDLITLVHHDEATLLVPVRIDKSVAPGTYSLKGKVRWLECEKLCIQSAQDIEVSLKVGGSSRAGSQAEAFAAAQRNIPTQLTLSRARAFWMDAPTGEVRRIGLQWAPTSQVAEIDFWSYESTNVTIRLTNQWSLLSGGLGQLTLWADKLEGTWPDQLQGLLVLNGSASNAVTGELRLPIESNVSLPSPSPSPVAAASASASASASAPLPISLPTALLFAFIGGLILNIMPCVLPVISLKILGFVQQSGDSPARVRHLGIIYALGVLFSFLVLAGVVIGLKKAGNVVSWGQQFSNPQFLIVLTTLITLVALNLFGVFEVTLGQAAGAAGQLARREGSSGAFFNGMLAVVLATPCTAPFMGPAIGFAFTQTPVIIVAIFSCVGLGLASPYVFLSWNPKWMKLLPRPGVWMERFKNAMGFPMLATAMWLFSLTELHFGDQILWLGLFLILVSAAAWVFGQFIQRGTQRSWLAWTAILVLLGFGYGYALEQELKWRKPPVPVSSKVETGIPPAPSSAGTSSETAIAWQKWSPEAVAKARAEGRVVFVDFTASWCLTCKVNMRSSIDIPSVRTRFKELNVAAFLADYSRTPEDMTAELLKWGRAGVPLVLVYPKDLTKSAQVLPEFLTPGIVMDALNRAQ